MDHHKNARLTYARRLEMVRNITEHRLTPAAAAAAAGVSEPTARKWLGRFLAGGEAALADASSRPASSPRRISESKALAIVELRKRRLTQARIAISMGVSEATVSRVLRRAGLSQQLARGGVLVALQGLGRLQSREFRTATCTAPRCAVRRRLDDGR